MVEVRSMPLTPLGVRSLLRGASGSTSTDTFSNETVDEMCPRCGCSCEAAVEHTPFAPPSTWEYGAVVHVLAWCRCRLGNVLPCESSFLTGARLLILHQLFRLAFVGGDVACAAAGTPVACGLANDGCASGATGVLDIVTGVLCSTASRQANSSCELYALAGTLGVSGLGGAAAYPFLCALDAFVTLWTVCLAPRVLARLWTRKQALDRRVGPSQGCMILLPSCNVAAELRWPKLRWCHNWRRSWFAARLLCGLAAAGSARQLWDVAQEASSVLQVKQGLAVVLLDAPDQPRMRRQWWWGLYRRRQTL